MIEGLGEPKIYHHLVDYSREEGGCGGLSDWYSQEMMLGSALSGVTRKIQPLPE